MWRHRRCAEHDGLREQRPGLPGGHAPVRRPALGVAFRGPRCARLLWPRTRCNNAAVSAPCVPPVSFVSAAGCSGGRSPSPPPPPPLLPPRYCCLPLRTEAPTEAWYCSQCSAAQQQAAKQQRAQRLAQKRKRQEQQQQRRRQRHLERQEKQRQQLGEEAKRRQKQERLGAEAPSAQPQGGTQEEGKGAGVEQAAQEGAAQRQQMLADQAGANSAAAAPTAAAADAAEAALEAATAKLEDALARAEAAAAAAAPAAGGQPGRMSQLKRSGLAAAIAAMGSGRGPAPAQPAGGRPSGPPGSTGPQQAQRAQQAQQTPGPSSACKDTLSTLFATLDRQDEASREQQRRVSSLLDGTSRLMQLHVRERAGRQQALQVRWRCGGGGRGQPGGCLCSRGGNMRVRHACPPTHLPDPNAPCLAAAPAVPGSVPRHAAPLARPPAAAAAAAGAFLKVVLWATHPANARKDTGSAMRPLHGRPNLKAGAYAGPDRLLPAHAVLHRCRQTPGAPSSCATGFRVIHTAGMLPGGWFR